jgi:hypothetical protein
VPRKPSKNVIEAPIKANKPALTIEYWPTERPKDYPQNARKWGKKAVSKVGASLKAQFIAAEQLGRRCYGVELEPKYCDIIVARWERFTGKKAVLG